MGLTARNRAIPITRFPRPRSGANNKEGKRMWQYIVKRLLLMIPTLIGAALLIFLLMNIIPGDVALLIIGGDQGGDINPRELAKLRTQLGLDRPLYEQFLTWPWS